MPAAVIDSIIEHVDSVEEPDFDLWHIGERLAGEGRLDALQALSANGDELERGLRQWRAGLGEFEAARLLLVEMTPALREGRRREWDDAEWLEGSTSPDLLPLLFDALAAALEVETDDPFGPARALQRAIYRIGGDEAVRSYDELIASSDESRFKFLRLHRDELVQAELRRAGQARVAEVAEALELPVLEPMEGP